MLSRILLCGSLFVVGAGACDSSTDVSKWELFYMVRMLNTFVDTHITDAHAELASQLYAANKDLLLDILRSSSSSACAVGKKDLYEEFAAEAAKINDEMGASHTEPIKDFLDLGYEILGSVEKTEIEESFAVVKELLQSIHDDEEIANAVANNDCATVSSITSSLTEFFNRFSMNSFARSITTFRAKLQLQIQLRNLPDMFAEHALTEVCYDASDENGLASLAISLRNAVEYVEDQMSSLTTEELDVTVQDVQAKIAKLLVAAQEIWGSDTELDDLTSSVVTGINSLFVDETNAQPVTELKERVLTEIKFGTTTTGSSIVSSSAGSIDSQAVTVVVQGSTVVSTAAPSETTTMEAVTTTAAPAETTTVEAMTSTAAPAETTTIEAITTTAAPAETTTMEAMTSTAAPAETTTMEAITTTAAPAETTTVEAMTSTAAPAETTTMEAITTTAAPAETTTMEAMTSTAAPAETTTIEAITTTAAPAETTTMEAMTSTAPPAETTTMEAITTTAAPAETTTMEAITTTAAPAETTTVDAMTSTADSGSTVVSTTGSLSTISSFDYEANFHEDFRNQYAEFAENGEIVYAISGGGLEVCEADDAVLSRQSSEWTTETLLAKAAELAVYKNNLNRYKLLNCDSGPDENCAADSVGTCDSTSTRSTSLYATDTTTQDGYRIIVSNGIPDHCYQNNQMKRNPNDACEVASAIMAPVNPRTTKPSDDDFYDTPGGPVGIATSGAFIYNHRSAETCNPATIQERQNFDPCDGHADARCRYHYHKAPVCMEGYDSCALLGYMIDGVPVYGMCTFNIDGADARFASCYRLNTEQADTGCDVDTDWTYRTDKLEAGDCHLDQANGYFFETEMTSTTGVTFQANTYAYFITLEFPFVMPKLANDFDRICYLPMNADDSSTTISSESTTVVADTTTDSQTSTTADTVTTAAEDTTSSGSSETTQASDEEPKPNIVFLMMDDVGWADVGWNNEAMVTPVLDSLRDEGVKLNHAYVTPRCTPTRSTLMTGYYPHRVGTQHGIFGEFEPVGVPLDFTFLPQKLQELGYVTHMVGKWHLGYCKYEYTPLARGFDNFVGYYMGGNDHYTHSTSSFNSDIGEQVDGFDMWYNDQPYDSASGTYTSEVFGSAAVDLLSSTAEPFFMYLPFRAPHPPLEAPQEYIDNCGQTDETRQTVCGMVNSVDTAFGNIVQALKDQGYYDNTIIVVQSDNGGDPDKGGFNYPLRGRKGTLFEGGTRTPAFVHAPNFVTTGERNDLIHVVDWYKTLLTAAGYDSTGDTDWEDMDSIDLWDMISTGADGSRTKMVYGVDDVALEYAIRDGQFKLMKGFVSGSRGGWYAPPEYEIADDIPDCSVDDCAMYLFDLDADPEETTDIKATSTENRQKKEELLLQLDAYIAEQAEVIDEEEDPAGNPANFGGYYNYGWC